MRRHIEEAPKGKCAVKKRAKLKISLVCLRTAAEILGIIEYITFKRQIQHSKEVLHRKYLNIVTYYTQIYENACT